jgi:nucleoside phosphorylase
MGPGESIFLHFINREVIDLYGYKIDPTLHVKYIKCAFWFGSGILYCSAAQVFECYFEYPELTRLISSLWETGWFEGYSASADPLAFIESRRRLYFGNKSSYPMYFGPNAVSSVSLGLTASRIDTSAALKKTLSGSLGGVGARHLDFHDLVIPSVRDVVKRIVDPDFAEGLTPRYVLTFDADAGALRRIGKELIASYAAIYGGLVRGWTLTSLPFFQDFENEESLPYLDWRILIAMAPRVGLSSLHAGAEWRPDAILRVDHNARARFKHTYRRFCKAAQHFCDVRSVAQTAQMASWIKSFPVNVAPIRSSLDFDGMHENLIAIVHSACKHSPSFEEHWLKQEADRLRITLLVTATDIEDEVVGTWLRREVGQPLLIKFGQQTCSVYESASLGRIVHARTSAGTTGTMGALATTVEVLSAARAELVVSVGICFGLDQAKQRLEDVAVSENVFEYERQRVTGQDEDNDLIQTRGDRIPASVELVSKARALRTGHGMQYGIHVGPFSSGDKLVDSARFRDLLKQLNPQAIAGEMEGAGVAGACQRMNVPYVLVKGICDWATQKDKDHQRKAAENAMDLAMKLLG